MAVIRHLAGNQPYTRAGLRVILTWNPEIRLWFVYDFADKADRPLFSTKRLEIHTVANYDEMKTKFAPHGSPTFIGTIVVESIMEIDDKELTRVIAHRYAPATLFFADKKSNKDLVPFDNCRRLLVDGSVITADRRFKFSRKRP